MNRRSKRPVTATRGITQRSRVTNGQALFAVAGDQRSAWARRFRDLIGLFAEDAGGAEHLTELKLSLIRRAAALSVECERLEGLLAEGATNVDVDLLARMSSHLRRIGESIGFDRVTMKDVTPSIADLVARHSESAIIEPADPQADEAPESTDTQQAPVVDASAQDSTDEKQAPLADESITPERSE